jgi:hypothetical protein
MSKFNTLFNKIINEKKDYSNNYHTLPSFIPVNKEHPGVGVDLRAMTDSVGWDIDAGITGGKANWNEINKDSVEFVKFEKGARAVLQHAKDYNASREDVNELKKRLLALREEYPPELGETDYIIFSVETDVNLGVFCHA